MTLDEYLKDNGITVTEFARRAGLSQPYIWQIVKGKRPTVGKAAAAKIENATNGAVTRMTLLYPEA